MKLKIGILGAESVGKSVLSEQLAAHYNGICVVEYAREYVQQLHRPYNYHDVELIAKKQIEQLEANYKTDYVFFDTELIVTKVWFEVKYGSVPNWLLVAIEHTKPDFCLLCMPDLPFEDDPVRENPHIRKELTDMYVNELEQYHIPFAFINGVGKTRLDNAINAISSFVHLR